MIFLLGVIGLLQTPAFQGATTPPSGDTIGYWQQNVHYQIVATLDEAQTKLRADGVLTYTNNSPDTLREMYFHQYLNAFRPGSKWSASDEHENRVRFQDLTEPNYGYERFTQAPVVNGVPVIVDYPGSPDSTVAHLRLPTPLAPHDSIRIRFVWDARPSTVTRRQGRRGRTWDFAQWFPKVAVYDRGGWEPNALVPAGELYGEYGTYDVTMVVRDDQIIASTGVPVNGDPGWSRVSRTGAPRLAQYAYGELPPVEATVPAGYRSVRFVAKDVHHFAWSASPDYRYEGGVYVRQVPHMHFPTWDTVSVNVLYKPGDDSTWGGGRALERTIFALKWLESIWGPYAYPQATNVHRLDPGGTEFPMMIMNGSASQGLILHELGHVFTYGILGNNEWRSGWMDEGLTSYQTDWAQKLTPQERIGVVPEPPRLPEGYRVNAVSIPRSDSTTLPDWRLEILGRAQPIGTNSADFSEFGIYNDMIYNRAKLMYGQLRDVMGDSAFREFFHDYYNRWALKHVDERAMRGSAARAYGSDLGWFFDEWVHGTGLMDYSLTTYNVSTDGSTWRTTARVLRRGELRHPMPVGVLTKSGWTIARADAVHDNQDVLITTNEAPLEVELDPNHVTWDWDWRNNHLSTFLITVREPRITYNWPYLDQADRSHTIVALSPAGWYTGPQGAVLGVRAKTNYLSLVDIHDGGIAVATKAPRGPGGHQPSVVTRAQIWARFENLYIPGIDRPLMGYGGAFNYLDGLLKIDAFKNWDLSPFIDTPGPTIKAKVYATVAAPTDSILLPEQWSDASLVEVGGSGSYKTTVTADSDYATFRGSVGAGAATRSNVTRTTDAVDHGGAYVRAEASIGAVRSLAGTASQLHVRLYGGAAQNAPSQRAVYASTQDPFETFTNDLFRPRDALLKQSGINYLPLGGAGLRGYRIDTPLDGVGAVNGEFVQRLATTHGKWGRATFSFSIFGDAAVASSKSLGLSGTTLADAGAGLIARGRLYDRDVHVRLDAPVLVNYTRLAGGKGLGGNGSLARRWVITVGELW
ncbi:MAG TPA: M1 family metallopeptidase [Gemmatimonadaceae bacterium]